MDWENGTVRIALTLVPGGPLAFEVTDFGDLIVPRRQPWGPSDFVNHAALRAVSEGARVLVIEMQSGDEITVEGASITWTGASE